MAKIEVEIQTPKVPNFIRIGGGEGQMIPVGDLPDATLRKVAEEWADDLIKNAERQRNTAPT